MTSLTYHDLQFALRRAPRTLLVAMAEPEWFGRVFVGGGFLRSIVANDPINDVDVFCPSRSDAELLARDLVGRYLMDAHPEKWGAEAKDFNPEEFAAAITKRVYETDNAFTLRCFKPTIQIIHRWTFQRAEDVINSFDFTCCCAVFYRDITHTWKSVCHPRFYADVAARRLVYLAPTREEEPGGSMLRVLKYYQKGYRIPLDSLGRIIARLGMAIKSDGWASEDHAGWVITGLLREVDPQIDPAHIAHLPCENRDGKLNLDVTPES